MDSYLEALIDHLSNTITGIGEFTTIAAITIIVHLTLQKRVPFIKKHFSIILAMFLGVLSYVVTKFIIVALLGTPTVAPW